MACTECQSINGLRIFEGLESIGNKKGAARNESVRAFQEYIQVSMALEQGCMVSVSYETALV